MSAGQMAGSSQSLSVTALTRGTHTRVLIKQQNMRSKHEITEALLKIPKRNSASQLAHPFTKELCNLMKLHLYSLTHIGIYLHLIALDEQLECNNVFWLINLLRFNESIINCNRLCVAVKVLSGTTLIQQLLKNFATLYFFVLWMWWSCLFLHLLL